MNPQSQNFHEFRRYEVVIAYKLIFLAARLLNVSSWWRYMLIHPLTYAHLRMVGVLWK